MLGGRPDRPVARFRVRAHQTAGGSGGWLGWRRVVVDRLSHVMTQRAEWTVPEKTASSATCIDRDRMPAPRHWLPRGHANRRP
jgi:hypothetical protein